MHFVVLRLQTCFYFTLYKKIILLLGTHSHTVKPRKPTAKGLPCAAHGKGHTANSRRQRASLPCAFFWHTAKPLPCASVDTQQTFGDDVDGHVCRVLPRPGTRQRLDVCRVLGFLHTANPCSLPCARVLAHGN